MITKVLKWLYSKSVGAALLLSFAVIPLPGFENNPTGFKLVHDHAEEWIGRNTIAVSNNRESFIAMDDRKGIQFQLWQLETLILQTNESEKLTNDKRERLLDRYEKKVDRLEEKLDTKNDRIDELDGAWGEYGIARTNGKTNQQ